MRVGVGIAVAGHGVPALDSAGDGNAVAYPHIYERRA
jgi:hypothetical protein